MLAPYYGRTDIINTKPQCNAVIAIYPYQTQEVRDLAWACFSPSLLHAQQLADDGQNVTDCGLQLTTQRRHWLESLDRDATALVKHLATQRSHRLGIYFEHLWHFFLEQDPDIDLVAHNLPIRHEGKTLGEFDCIYFCHQRQRHFHLELAVKFFLGHRHSTTHEHASHWSEWLGPSSNDRLDRKIEHLMQRQIQLGNQPAAQQVLEKLGITALAREVEIKGYLFRPAQDALPPPYGFNPDGRLCHHVELPQLGTYLAEYDSRSTASYLMLPKRRWLSPASLGVDTALNSANLSDCSQKQLAEDSRPRLIAAIDSAGQESRRFFVTAAGWPLRNEKVSD